MAGAQRKAEDPAQLTRLSNRQSHEKTCAQIKESLSKQYVLVGRHIPLSSALAEGRGLGEEYDRPARFCDSMLSNNNHGDK